MTLNATHPGAFIGGHWHNGQGPHFSSLDPATEKPVWAGREASPEQVGQAVTSARAAFQEWARTPLARRIEIAKAFEVLLGEQADVIAETICRETGKAYWEGRGEAAAMKGKIAISIAALQERAGDRSSETAFGHASLTHRPHGVMAVLGPFNFPGHLPNGHIVPALLAGNTVVFKPSEFAPAIAQLCVRLWQEAGLPEGVLNLVQGGRDTGAALLDAQIDGLLFTGSAQAGRAFHAKFAGRPEVILALEMGGNNPLIVWPPADAEAAADIIVQSAFITTGQRCSCARRLYLPNNDFAEAVLNAVQARMDVMQIGPWNASDPPFMGSLINADAARKALAFQDDLIARGGSPIQRLKMHDAGPAFVSPGLINMTGVDGPDEELFGPVLQVWRMESFDAAIEAANRSRFGLSGGLVSDDSALWDEAVLRVRAGVLNWNRPTTGASSALPFGGPGLSGNHRPSAYYAADYCAWPVASQTAPKAVAQPVTGIVL
jgi:succinylglutamic semialdehyde dehydrogenase